MKSIAVAALVLAALANAQSPAAPACATTCVAQTPTSCAASDIGCLCHDQNFITQATQCIEETCKGSDLTAAEQFAQQLCATVGVTLTSTPPIPTSTGSGPASTGATDSGSPSQSATSPASSASGSSTPGSAASGSTTPSSSSPAASSGAATEIQAGLTGLMGAVLALFTL